jgi:N-acetylglucosamine-6-phosphate deacetylase
MNLPPRPDTVLLAAGTVATGEALLRPGWVEISGDTVLAVGEGLPPRPADLDLGNAMIIPGFVDMHVHGGGGGAFPTGDPQDALVAARMHRDHGTTTMLASLVTAAPDELLRQVAVMAELTEQGLIAGTHLEGPWLSADRGGAHELSQLRDPDPAELARVLAAGRGTIRMVTLAPERAGGLDAVRRVVDAGAVAAIGHTDATYDQARAAVDAGATVGTHLFNAMRPVHHREPGPVIALLEDPRVTVELITDGVHLHPALYRDVAHTAGPDRVALVTDAMVAAGMPDGGYHLGGLAVTVADGVARLTGSETIAGSTATMDAIFRYAVANSALPVDLALLQAVRQTSVNPAAALGLPVAGLATGRFADLVVLDANLGLRSVLARGEWVIGRPGAAAG